MAGRFNKGDIVTFSDKCPVKYRKVFKNGPRKIKQIIKYNSFPYSIGDYGFKPSELKLVQSVQTREFEKKFLKDMKKHK